MDSFLLCASWCCSILLGLSAFFDHWAPLANRTVFQGRPVMNTAFLGRPSFKLGWFIVFTLLSMWLTFYTGDRSQRKAQEVIEKQETAGRKHTDSAVTAARDSTISTINALLGGRNLVYDTLEKRIRDVVKPGDPEIPDLDISSTSNTGTIKRKVDSLYYNLILKNTGNCPVRVDYKVYGAVLNGLKLDCEKTDIGMENYIISQTLSINFPIRMHYQQLPSTVYFLILGRYSNEQRTIGHPIDVLLEWDLSMNEVGVSINSEEKKKTEKMIKSVLHL